MEDEVAANIRAFLAGQLRNVVASIRPATAD
jgi:hypothetical protein